MLHMLLVFDRHDQRIISMQRFDDRGEALEGRFEAERLHRGDQTIEIVVLSGASEESIRRTHGRYFESAGELYRDAIRRVRQDRLTGEAARDR